MADDVPLSSLFDVLAARRAQVPLSSLNLAPRNGVDWSQLQLRPDVGFDQQGNPMRVDRSDVMRMSPLIEQGLEAGRKIISDPQAFLRGEAPLQDPIKNAAEIPEENPMMGMVSSLKGATAEAAGKALVEAASRREHFDPLLTEIGDTFKSSDLKEIYRHITGYDYYPKSGTTGTKADIVKALRNWQREVELNADLSAAQAKNAP